VEVYYHGTKTEFEYRNYRKTPSEGFVFGLRYGLTKDGGASMYAIDNMTEESVEEGQQNNANTKASCDVDGCVQTIVET